MHRIYLFLAILVASLVALVAVVAVGLALFSSSPWNWYGMGGMMQDGGMMDGTLESSVGSYFWVAFIVLVGVVVVGVVGLVYYIAVPEIRVSAAPVVCETVPKGNVVQENVAPQNRKLNSPRKRKESRRRLAPR
jgi:hypothetical protein